MVLRNGIVWRSSVRLRLGVVEYGYVALCKDKGGVSSGNVKPCNCSVMVELSSAMSGRVQCWCCTV